MRIFSMYQQNSLDVLSVKIKSEELTSEEITSAGTYQAILNYIAKGKDKKGHFALFSGSECMFL